MIQFHLGRIPVRVHFSHLLLSLVLAVLWQDSFAGPNGWPGRILRDRTSPEYGQTLVVYGLMFVAMVFVSVLVHELGHAVVARAWGYRPVVELVSLGGRTFPNANETIPWHKDVLLTLAGPFFGFGFALLLLAIRKAIGAPSEPIAFAFKALLAMNIGWGVLNLIPVYPLDGGKISVAVLQRIFGKKGFLIAQGLSLALSVGAALLWLSWGGYFGALLFGMWAFQTFALIQSYRRGQLDPTAPRHPAELAFTQAQALYQQGKRSESQRLAEAILSSDISPALRSKVHHLLGWIALKDGEGRPALDHFSQVNRDPVENKALAAAFSLIGDDVRAASFWELSSREAPSDATLLHEWAGALLRLDQLDRVRHLPGVELKRAFDCASRVPFIRGDYAAAARLGEQSLALTPDAETAYDAACARAHLGERDAAVRLLTRASELGFRDAGYAESDADLAALHGYPPFHTWLDALRVSAAS